MSTFVRQLCNDVITENFTFRFPNRLPILMYHRILPAPDPLQPDALTAAQFSQQIDLLQQYFTVLPLDEALARLKAEQLPPKTVAITFDDSYRETRLLAAPILHRAGVHATAFLSTDHLYLGTRPSLMFNDFIRESIRHSPLTTLDTSPLGLPGVHSLIGNNHKIALISKLEHFIKYQTLPLRQQSLDTLRSLTQVEPALVAPRMMMTPEEVRELEWLNITIGGHTHTHPIMTQTTPADLRKDLELNLRVLRSLTSQRVRAFAYPNGRFPVDFTLDHAALIRSLGYSWAVSTHCAVASPSDNPFLIPRFATKETGYRFLWRILRMLKFDNHPASGLVLPSKIVEPTATSTPTSTATSYTA